MSNAIELDFQNPDNIGLPVAASDFTRWSNAAFEAAREHTNRSTPLEHDPLELTVRVANTDEAKTLNLTYRGKDYPTNVLSFPFEAPPGIDLNLLGDIVICAQVVIDEATQQNKNIQSHWAHLTIHGTLHLLGFDHIDDADADIMEAIEINAMATLGYTNPYDDVTIDT